jgi:hypothetical protein
MVKENQIIEVHINQHEIGVVNWAVETIPICGHSHVRHDRQTRKRNWKLDSWVGQLGNCAFSKYYFGSIQPYIDARTKANENPYVGDGGQDFINTNIDVKSSRQKTEWSTPLKPIQMTMGVRPGELHTNWLYVSCVVDYWENWKDNDVLVYVMGWVTTEMLPKQVNTSGYYAGAYTLLNSQLNPFPFVRWDQNAHEVKLHTPMTQEQLFGVVTM